MKKLKMSQLAPGFRYLQTLALNFNKPGGSYNYTASKIEMNHQKRTKTLKFLETMWNDVFCILKSK